MKTPEEKNNWKEFHENWGLGDQKYEIGDIVTRTGSDEHKILSIDYDWITMDVECIKEPTEPEPGIEGDDWKPWIRLGETETNLIRRYQLVRKAKENQKVKS